MPPAPDLPEFPKPEPAKEPAPPRTFPETPPWVQRLCESLASGQVRREHKSATIRIDPTVKWPVLTDDVQDVQEFFESFEEFCGLASDGEGMSDKEMLKVLLTCLRGTREKTYQVIHQLNRSNGCLVNNPQGVYTDI